ncbi:MAG: hypothetical protein NTV63_02790, partial [Candidatus Woesearchaeota archaeon]|nr:hypothetical protein [Candidatus Woesearchaeota archaeon]
MKPIELFVKIIKIPFQLVLSLFPMRARIFLSSVDTSIRFNAVKSEILLSAKKNRKHMKESERIKLLDVG